MTFLRGFDNAIKTSLVVGALLLLLLGASFVYAQDRTAAIAQGFQTSESNLTTGVLLSLESASANSVSLATQSNSEQLVGVLGEEALIELDGEDSNSIQVVTSGVGLALVSDINGEVKNGDKITTSPINGIGMKATQSATIVGIAQADMSTFDQSERTIQAEDGSNVTVRIALVPTQINVTFYASGDSSSIVPSFIQAFANTVAGKEVSAIRVIIAGLFLVIALVSIAVLLYSSVQSSIISIGRNPLSEGAVRKGLVQVGVTITGILLLTVIAIYLVLIT